MKKLLWKITAVIVAAGLMLPSGTLGAIDFGLTAFATEAQGYDSNGFCDTYTEDGCTVHGSECNGYQPTSAVPTTVTIRRAELRENILSDYNTSFEEANDAENLWWWNDASWGQTNIPRRPYGEAAKPADDCGDYYVQANPANIDDKAQCQIGGEEIAALIKGGKTYEYSYYAKLAEGEINGTVTLSVIGDWSTSAEVTQDEEVTLNDAEWKKVTGTFTLASDASCVVVRFEGTAGVAFCLDDLRVAEERTPVSLKEGSAVTLKNSILTYGEALSKLAFNSAVFVDDDGNEVSGTLAWKTPDKKPNAGTPSATWVFTPTDDSYATVEDIVAITVNKATPQVTTLPTVAERTYNPTVSLADSDLTGGTVNVSGHWSWQSANIIPTVNNSGYVAVFTPTDTTNYETVTGTITVTVSKATPYIKTAPTAAAITYGDTLGASTLTGGTVQYSNSDATAVSGSFAWADNSMKPSVSDSNTTSYTIVFTPSDTDNYNTAETYVTLTVNKKKVAVPTADSTVYTYNGVAQTYGVVSTADYTVTGGTQTNAGEYPITITLNNENYEWDGTLGTYTFVIKQAAVTITANSYTVNVGNALPTFGYKVSGLVNNEELPISVAVSCTATDSTTAGTYPITVSGDASSTNYTFAYVNGTLTISAKDIQTIAADDVTLFYGDTGKKITATTDGDGAISYVVKTGDDVISVAANGTITAKKAGTATVAVTAAETDSYTAAVTTVTVTVNKAAVTIKADDKTVYQNAALPAFTYSVTGLANGDTLAFTPVLTCAAADTSTIGTYAITITIEITEDTKYTYTTTNGTLTVKKKSSGSGGGGGGYRPSTPTEPNNPSIGGSSKSWSDVAADLGKLTTGSEATIELNGNTTVPVDVIKAIADKDIKVTFVIDSVYSWVVDGAKITTPVAIDLTLTKTASTKSDSLRGIEGTQFRLNGTNLPTDLMIAFKKEHAGKFANLYKVVDGKLVFVTCAKLGEDGKVILPDVVEKGDYVAMLCEFSDRLGDMDNDGVMNAKDASAILKDIVELEPGKNPLMADFNGDGKMNALDASAILKRIVGLA